jgi:hypothetical protein
VRLILRAQLLQLFLDRLIAAVDVIDALDLGAPSGHQAGQHQARRGAQVRRHHRRGGQLVHALDDRGVALEPDLGAHAAHFQHVHEAVFENRLDDGADAVRHRVERGELRLHVGRKRRIRRGAHVDRARPAAAHVDFDPVVADVDFGAGLRSLSSTASRCSGACS